MKVDKVNIAEVKLNEDNPRTITGEKFEKLKKSIVDFPEMLELRPIVVDEDMVALGGNMRLKACIDIGLTDVYICKWEGLTEEQKKEFIVKDNINYGVWDWDILGNEYNPEELKSYGLNVWQPDEFEEDEYDWEDEGNEEGDVKPSNSTPKPTVFVVEFDANDYPAAIELSKEITSKGGDISDILVKLLKDNYEG